MRIRKQNPEENISLNIRPKKNISLNINKSNTNILLYANINKVYIYVSKPNLLMGTKMMENTLSREDEHFTNNQKPKTRNQKSPESGVIIELDIQTHEKQGSNGENGLEK